MALASIETSGFVALSEWPVFKIPIRFVHTRDFLRSEEQIELTGGSIDRLDLPGELDLSPLGLIQAANGR